jgi:uncharacterized protein (DUF2237 family)
MDERNVLGEPLEPCSEDPMTGYLRDGCCRHQEEDVGRHEVCAVLTEEFLSFSKARGNDLVTPRPEHGFPGLDPGDRWCLCLGRWVEALDAGVAPPVVLDATNEAVLEEVDRSTLDAHEYDLEDSSHQTPASTETLSSPKRNGDSPEPDHDDRLDM